MQTLKISKGVTEVSLHTEESQKIFFIITTAVCMLVCVHAYVW